MEPQTNKLDLKNGVPYEVRASLDFLLRKTNNSKPPDLCVVLGSGFSGKISEKMENVFRMPYKDIDHFPVTTIEGHPGNLIIGDLFGKRIAIFEGRSHFYEGLPIDQLILPVRMMAFWGVENFLLTNAAGALNEGYLPGNFMIMKDHINKMGVTPLTGENRSALGSRFTDMTNAYSSLLMKKAVEAASLSGCSSLFHEGTYVAVPGPQYETPAEIQCYKRSIGADAIGMSVVLDVIALNHMKSYTKEDRTGGERNIQILAVSCITNMGAGLTGKSLNHEEVIKTGKESEGTFQSWFENFIKII